MYKHVHPILIVLSKKVRSGAMLSTTGFVNNNFVMHIPAASKISLNTLTCNITKRHYSKINEDSDSKFEKYLNTPSPSVEVEKKIQQDAQKRLDDLLANHPKLDKLYKTLELEFELLRQSDLKVPRKIKPTHWLQLLKMNKASSRRAYLQFIWTNEIKKKYSKSNRRAVSLLKKIVGKKNSEESNSFDYNTNSLFTCIYKSTISQFMNKKLITAMMFGEKLVIDCGFESHMTHIEICNCARQILSSFSMNRASKDPFDIYLCNVNLEGELKRRILSLIPTMDNSGFPLNVTSQSYLEIFPKEKLVYLTPHTSNVMHKYNPDNIYIIGGIVNKVHDEPLSVLKAMEEGLQVAQFPLANYLDWKAGSSKSLDLNHCVEIMVDIKYTSNWEYALRIVPSGDIMNPYTEYDNSPKVMKTFQNYEPKFHSAQASHVPDLTYYKKMSQKK